MGDMKRSQMAILAAFGLLSVLAPAVAQAQVIELGAPRSALVAPSCPPTVKPANCTIILTQVTALETIRDGIAYPTKVTKAGRIVAFTLGLSRLDSNRTRAKQDIHFLDSSYGGVPLASVTVLRPVGKASQHKWAVTGESPAVHLIPYLGQVVQFPLDRSLEVRPGYVVALTVPTWAPVLSFNLGAKNFAYRQSRTTGCNNAAPTEMAQLTIGATARYGCDYPGTRVEYSATEVTNAAQTKNYVHAPDRPTK